MNDYGMNVSDQFAAANVLLRVVIFALLLWHLSRAVTGFRRYADERADITLVKAISLVVISGGLVASALGLLDHDSNWAIGGLAITTGALLILALTLLVYDLRPPKGHP